MGLRESMLLPTLSQRRRHRRHRHPNAIRTEVDWRMKDFEWRETHQSDYEKSTDIERYEDATDIQRFVRHLRVANSED
jgi:hypothetical protein